MKYEALIIALTIACGVAHAQPIGSEFAVSASAGARFPDVAYNSTNGLYLVVYTNYGVSPARIVGRRVSDAGALLGGEFAISDATGGLFSAVAYNDADNEFLVTWDDLKNSPPEAIWAQRIRGSDGAPIGGNFRVSTGYGNYSAVAWSPLSRVYLVVWATGSPRDVYGQRVSATGNIVGPPINISHDDAGSFYPAVAHGTAGDQFLVTWDHNPEGDFDAVRGQRVAASDGALLGGGMNITLGGDEDRSCIAHDPIYSRWLVQYNQHTADYSQDARLVSADGTLIGGAIPLAHTPAFEGDTLFGGDVCGTPRLGRWFSSFVLESGSQQGMGLQESYLTGAPAAPQASLSTPGRGSLNNAADTNLNRVLTVWGGPDAPGLLIWGRLYQATTAPNPGPVTQLVAEPGPHRVILRWTNPADPSFIAAMVRYKMDSPPAHPGDGILLADDEAVPGTTGCFVHEPLTAGTLYHYAVFARDGHPSFAAGSTAGARAVTQADFDADGDVDLTDFGIFQVCFNGPNRSAPSGCGDVDFDFDLDVDLSDFAIFQTCFNGPNRDPGCPTSTP